MTIPRYIPAVLVLLLAAVPLAAAPAGPIASRYPRDQGIANDPDVIWACDFESGDFRGWDQNDHPNSTAIVSDPRCVFAGSRAVQMTATLGGSTGGSLIKRFRPGFDTVYARFYVKFAPNCDYVHHFVNMSAERDPGLSLGKAGIRPNGDDWFYTGVEPFGEFGRNPPPGVWNFYSYWPDMKGSPGKYWGNSFGLGRRFAVVRDRWICVEFMVKCNTPGQPDGVEDFWIDGQQAGPFGDFRWRTTPNLKVNAFWLLYYVTDNTIQQNNQTSPNRVNTVWFDNVVIARSYIGPGVAGKPAPGKSGGTGKAVAPPPGWGAGENR